MQHSKFVNTKAYQKANNKKDPLQFPIFGRSNNSTQFQKLRAEAQKPVPKAPIEVEKTELLDSISVISPNEKAAEQEAEVKTHEIHASVNFQEMQRIEDLHKADEDWLAFFLGKTQATEIFLSTNTEVAVASFADPFEPGTVPIIPSPPVATAFEEAFVTKQEASSQANSGECLDKIFKDLISDDKFFSVPAHS